MTGSFLGSRWMGRKLGGGLCQVGKVTVAPALLLLSILIKKEVLSSRQCSPEAAGWSTVDLLRLVS